MQIQKARKSRGLLLWGVLALGSVGAAAPLERGVLWTGVPAAAAVRLAETQLELARVRLAAGQGWAVSAAGSANIAKTPLAPQPLGDAVASVQLRRPGSGAQDPERAALAQAVRRAEGELRRARLGEWRARAGAWNELAQAQAELEAAQVGAEASALGERAIQGRAEQGGATALQVQSAQLDRQRADLRVTQARARLDRARAGLLALGVDDPGATPGAWAPLPRPDLSAGDRLLRLGARAEVLEAELALESARAALAQARQSARPTLGVQGELTQGRLSVSAGLDLRGNAEASAGIRLRGEGSAWSLGLRASVPLGGQAGRLVGVAERSVALAQASLEQVLAGAARDLRAREQALDLAGQGLDLALASLEAQREAERVSAQRREQGLISESDVLQARAQTLRAAQSVAEARAEIDTATLNLWEAAGWLP